MTFQSDLFGAGPPPPRRPMAVQPQPARPAMLAHFPVPSSMPWARELTKAEPTSHDVTIMVPLLWTGEVLEVLAFGAAGRKLLMKTGEIKDIPPDGGQSGRIVYMHAEAAKKLHAERPLVVVGTVGTVCTRYRFAAPGEAVDPVLALPLDYGG